MKRITIGVLLLVLVALSASAQAQAPALVNGNFDGPFTVREAQEVEVSRGRGLGCNGINSWEGSSLDDAGMIVISITPPSDDRTPAELIGYRVIHLEGDLQGELSPDYDFRIEGEAIYLHWIDGRTDDQEPIDLTIAIQAIDLAGNLGARSDPVTIRHPGSGGCATAAHNTLEAWMCLLAVSLVYLRRRRRA